MCQPNGFDGVHDWLDLLDKIRPVAHPNKMRSVTWPDGSLKWGFWQVRSWWDCACAAKIGREYNL